MTTKSEIKSKLNHGGEHLGDIVWWSLLDSAVKVDVFKAAWLAEGLDEKHLPETPTARRALADAGRQSVVAFEHYLYRPAGSTDTETIFAIVREDQTSPGEVKLVQEAKVAVDNTTGTFVTDAPSHRVVQAVQAKYDSLFGCYQSREVRRSILNVIESCSSITLRDNGGVYWVPRTGADKVRSVSNAVTKIGGSTFDVLPVHASKEAVESLGRAAKGSLEADLVALKEELDGFAVRDDVRPSTLENRLEAFAALRERADLYRGILSVQVDDLGAKIEALEAEATAMINTIAERKEKEKKEAAA